MSTTNIRVSNTMSNYIGWFNTSITNDESIRVLNEITNSRGGSNSFDTKVSETFGFAAKKDYFASRSNISVAYSGNIYWSDSFGESKFAKGTALGIIWAYEKYGLDFVSYLKGAFSIALIDQNKKCTILALDPIGQKSLYYGRTQKGIVFGSMLSDVVSHPEINSGISHQTVFDYVYFHHCPSPRTIYEDLSKLEGGQIIVFEQGSLRVKYFVKSVFLEEPLVSEEESCTKLRSTLASSVKQLALNSEKTGAFLSGGLDSSTISGLLAQVYPGRCKTFSIGFPVDGYDETEYARIAANHFNTQRHEYCLTPEDTLSSIKKIASFYDEPFGNSSAIPTYYCAKLAKENGVERLLAGDGGDELFAGNERYLKQLLFERYKYIPVPLRTVINSMLNKTPNLLLENKLIYKAKRYVDQASIPLPDRLQDYNFLHRHSAREVFTDDFLSDVNENIPIQLLRESYNRPENASALNRMLVMDWKTTLHDSDLVKVNKMCDLAGVDVVYPMLDSAVVDLSRKIPSSVKTKNGQLRGFFKQAFSDFLPKEILNKPKHGFGLPFGVWVKDVKPLREFAYDSVSDLGQRHYIKKSFLDHAIRMHQNVHASYYGELIWVLMMLEQWFATRPDERVQ